MPDLELGKLYQTRSVEKIPGARDGGVVTGLLGHSPDKGIIKVAVVLGRDSHRNTLPALVTESKRAGKVHGKHLTFP